MMCLFEPKIRQYYFFSSIVRVMLIVALAVLLSIGTIYAATVKQKQFASPEEATKALITAIKANDNNELMAIFGPPGKALIFSGDEVGDRAARARFEKAYDEMNQLERRDAKRVILHVGSEDWPFPIPIVKQGNFWYFNTIEGRQEILDRRIGRDELGAIQVCLAFVDAQREYASRDRTGDGVLQYAQKFPSEPGKKDGLYWPVSEGEEASPLGPLVAEASTEGYGSAPSTGQPIAYHGYFYRILKQQGKNALGGARDYVVRGKMIGGFALVAYPAEYGNSGVMTFIVNQDGVVYQKDLGKKTTQAAKVMKSFDPDKTWEKVE
jgi:hypothetical protein